MGCSGSKSKGNAAPVKRSSRLLQRNDSGQYPHCSASEVAGLRMSCEVSDTDPAPLEQRGSNNKRGAGGGGSDIFPEVTRKNLSDIKRLRTNDKIRTWQHTEQNVKRSVSQQPSPPTNTTPRQGAANNVVGAGLGTTSPRKTLSAAPVLQRPKGPVPPSSASSNSGDSSSKGVDDGMVAGGDSSDAPVGEGDNGEEAPEGVWKKRISILAARCLASGGVLHNHSTVPTATTAATEDTPQHRDGAVVVVQPATATATSPRAIATALTPAATSAIASNAGGGATGSGGSAAGGSSAVGEQTKFVVVAKVNNPFTGVNLVYRKSEHVIGIGSSATVYLGSVTTTTPLPSAGVAGTTSQHPNANNGAAAAAVPATTTRKFLTAIKEILVSPAAVLFESPAGEQVAMRRRQEAIDSVKQIQDVHQLLRQEFRFLKSLDGCAQVVRVLHVAVTAADSNNTSASPSASPLVGQGSISPGGSVVGEQLTDEALGCLPLHMRPQRARIFMEYVKFGTLLAESRRLFQLYHQCGRDESGSTTKTAPSTTTEATQVCGPGAFRMHELTARAYMKDVLLGLCYLHEHKCLHRDVKPQNILVHALVEDMYETAFPVCLEDSVTVYTPPPPSDDDEDAEAEENFRPVKKGKQNSNLSRRVSNIAKKSSIGGGVNGGNGGGALNEKWRAQAQVATKGGGGKATPDGAAGADVPLIAVDVDGDAVENRSRQRQGQRSCTMLDVDGMGADGRITPSLSQQRNASPLPPAVSGAALDDLSPLQAGGGGAYTNSRSASRSPAPLVPIPRTVGMSTIELQDNVLRTTTVPVLRHNQHANHRDKLKTLIKLTDFGSARWTIPTGLEQGEGGTIGFLRETAGVGCPTTMNVVGTAPYMSPESIRGKFSAASDVWSFAITFLEMVLPSDCSVWSNLNAKDPFQLILRLGTAVPPEHMPHIPASLSPECRAMLARCLAFDPSQRPTALELLQGLYFGTTGWIAPRLMSGAMEAPWQENKRRQPL